MAARIPAGPAERSPTMATRGRDARWRSAVALSALISAWLAGVLGGAHCLAMCGGFLAGVLRRRASPRRAPLLPARRAGAAAAAVQPRPHHDLRRCSARAFGAAGSVGARRPRDWLPLQRGLFVVANLFLLALAAAIAWKTRWLRRAAARGRRAVPPAARRRWARWPRATACRARYALGMVWGLVPCALIYSVLPIALFAGGRARGRGRDARLRPRDAAQPGGCRLVRRPRAAPGSTAASPGTATALLLAGFAAVGIWRALFGPLSSRTARSAFRRPIRLNAVDAASMPSESCRDARIGAMTDAPSRFPTRGRFPMRRRRRPAAAALYRSARGEPRRGHRRRRRCARPRCACGARASCSPAAATRWRRSSPEPRRWRSRAISWRQLDAAWRDAATEASAGLAVTVFAIPVVDRRRARSRRAASATLPAVLALAGEARRRSCASTARSPATRASRWATSLVAADAIDVAAAAGNCCSGSACPTRRPAAARCRRARSRRRRWRSPPAARRVHLRFLVGSALARPGADLLADDRRSAPGGCRSRASSRASSATAARRCWRCRARRSARCRPCGRAASPSARSPRRSSRATRCASCAHRSGEPDAMISAHRAADARAGRRAAAVAVVAVRAARGRGIPLPALPAGSRRRRRDDARRPAARLPGDRRPDARRRAPGSRRRRPGCRCSSSPARYRRLRRSSLVH